MQCYFKVKVVGIVASGFLVILSAAVSGNEMAQWFSPVSWTTLNKLDVGKLTISYIYLCDGCLYDSDYYFKCMDYKSNRKKGCRSNDTGGINMEKLIQIKNLTKCFGETKVLDKINVNFDRGHIYGIIGRNGSGKSMLMKCICGLVVPTSGEIIIDNKN